MIDIFDNIYLKRLNVINVMCEDKICYILDLISLCQRQLTIFFNTADESVICIISEKAEHISAIVQ